MRRRDFVQGIAAATAWPPTARAQQIIQKVIGFLHFGAFDASGHLVAAFEQGLRESGYIQGKNVQIEVRNAFDLNFMIGY
jgi:putative ABC transport system substrate-binding protein